MVDELFQEAVRKWGADFQFKVVAEECAELIKAVLKYNRKLNPSTLKQLVDEAADVQIMLGQLPFIVAFCETDVSAWEFIRKVDKRETEKLVMLKEKLRRII